MKNYFDIKELVSPEIYTVLGDASKRLFYPGMLDSLNSLREDFGTAITVNDWYHGGQFRYSGIRPIDCIEGAENSRHKLTVDGCVALDLKCKDIKLLTSLVKRSHQKYGIYRIENPDKTKTWLHCEFYENGMEYLTIFNP